MGALTISSEAISTCGTHGCSQSGAAVSAQTLTPGSVQQELPVPSQVLPPAVSSHARGGPFRCCTLPGGGPVARGELGCGELGAEPQPDTTAASSASSTSLIC